MTIDDNIRDEKLRHEINREATKISAKTLDTPYKHEHLTGKEIIPSDKKQLIEQIKFQYGPLGKALEKQKKKQLKIKEKNKLKQLKRTVNNYLNLIKSKQLKI